MYDNLKKTKTKKTDEEDEDEKDEDKAWDDARVSSTSDSDVRC